GRRPPAWRGAGPRLRSRQLPRRLLSAASVPDTGGARRRAVAVARAPCQATGRTERRGRARGSEGLVIAVDHQDGIAVVRLEHGKVNVLDLELLEAIASTLRTLD